jgi:hypothetical protein
MKLSSVARLFGGSLIALALGAILLTQGHISYQGTPAPGTVRDGRQAAPGATLVLAAQLAVNGPRPSDGTPAPPGSGSATLAVPPAPTAANRGQPSTDATPGPYQVFLPLLLGTEQLFLPLLLNQTAEPSGTPTQPEPPPVPPLAGWPDGLGSRTDSKLGLHVVRNNDSYILEYVRRVRPRVMKSVDDLGWLSDVKLASPNTVTIGRISGQNENWPEQLSPEAAATQFINANLNKYRLNPGVDYWEGWNEFVPVTEARWKWYAAFEAARACDMQALGLHAAVGGFAAGTPEYNEMAFFLPALEAAHRCGGIFTLHEGVSPLPGCGIFMNKAAVIPGAPAFPGVNVGYIMLRYRFWYEGYLKPMGLGDLPLEISELEVGGIVPGSPCDGPGGASWMDFIDFWVHHGVGPDGPHAWANLLAWYDSEIRLDPYVLGTTVFTARAINDPRWGTADLHQVIIPLAFYETSQQ